MTSLTNLQKLQNLANHLGICEDRISKAIKDTGFTFEGDGRMGSSFVQNEAGLEIWATPGWEDEEGIVVQVMKDGDELACETVPMTCNGDLSVDLDNYIRALQALIKKYESEEATVEALIEFYREVYGDTEAKCFVTEFIGGQKVHENTKASFLRAFGY